MKPAPVAYRRAGSLDEALEYLDQHGEDAKVIAGGQSLIPLLNLRLARPDFLIDVNRLAGHDFIRPGPEALVIGALTRHVSIERSQELDGPWHALSEAARLVGHLPIRVRGTFGGSLSHAEPTAEFPLVAVTLGATIVTQSKHGRREIAAEHFFRGPLTTDLSANELLVEIRFPAPPPGAATAFEEFSERAGDFATAAVCVGLSLAKDTGRCEWARIGLGAVAPVPVRSTRAEEILCGAELSNDVIREAASAAQADCDPTSDLHGSAQFRRELAGTLVERALRRVTAWLTESPR